MTTSHEIGVNANLAIRCNGPVEIVAATDDVMPKLRTDVRRAFNRIKVQLLQQVGEQGLFDRFNNRTVASLLEEFETAKSIAPIEHRELNGVRYELFEAQKPAPTESPNDT